MEKVMMTEEQVMDKFKNCLLKFDHYYKYTFSFVGYTNDGYKITCRYGGSSEDIYRYDVSATAELRFTELDEWNSVEVHNGKNERVFSHYNECGW